MIGGVTITGIENVSFVQGSNFADTIDGRSTGTGYSDFAALMGMGGNDMLIAGYYTGTLYGGDGDDIVDGRGSQYLQAVYGDDGDDTLYTNSNTFATAYGGAGDDTIYAHGTVYGGSGNDLIVMQPTYYQGNVYGEDGDDEIRASANGNIISGGDGADVLGAAGLTSGNLPGDHGNFAANAALYAVGTDWNVVGIGDFNGDGRDDILWRNADGRIGDWLADANGNFVPNAPLYAVGNDWTVQPHPDLLF